jgi:hypothetical protein
MLFAPTIKARFSVTGGFFEARFRSVAIDDGPPERRKIGFRERAKIFI